ncbi:MAG: CHAP domain-containing protein [Saprospirales bacterium]|jgi:hypothetical protein|nr:CHAP domain-containing protein [Saprospirales bacterium]MBK6903602.1 CHAP domain-containing protein [Saprospirales bacterium]MBK7338680.1 CHAP domain-containing protein [Saprospirales bacterium]
MKKIWKMACMACLVAMAFSGMRCVNEPVVSSKVPLGKVVDSLNWVFLYHNPPAGSIDLDTLSEEQKMMVRVYTSGEYARRYYGLVFGIPLPQGLNSGTDFFNPSIADGQVNPATGLTQFAMPSATKPQENDILVFGDSRDNPGGNVAIVAKVGNTELEIVQQNPGPLSNTRESYRYYIRKNKWYVQQPHVLGWLRKP